MGDRTILCQPVGHSLQGTFHATLSPVQDNMVNPMAWHETVRLVLGRQPYGLGRNESGRELSYCFLRMFHAEVSAWLSTELESSAAVEGMGRCLHYAFCLV